MATVLVDEEDRAFLQLLQAKQTATINDLCEAVSVTATAIRQRLMRLQDQGLITRITVKTGRGRPHHKYTLTDSGRNQLGDNYGELALLLWEEVQRIPEEAVKAALLQRLRERMVRRYGDGVTAAALPERMAQLEASMRQRGFPINIEQHEGMPVLVERHCPYHSLASSDSQICSIEQQVFEQVLGVQLRLTQCCRDGSNQCVFHPAASDDPDCPIENRVGAVPSHS